MHMTHHKLATGAHQISLKGPLNVKQAEQLGRCFQDLAAQGVDNVVVNLAEVPFIDGPGLAALIVGYKLFGRGEQNFRLVGLQNQPKLVLELTGFEHIFSVFERISESPVAQLPELMPADNPAPAFSCQAIALVDMAA
jgi:anti-anti-sigma factor